MYQIEDLIKEIRDSKEEPAKTENAIAQLKKNPVTVYTIGNTLPMRWLKANLSAII